MDLTQYAWDGQTGKLTSFLRRMQTMFGDLPPLQGLNIINQCLPSAFKEEIRSCNSLSEAIEVLAQFKGNAQYFTKRLLLRHIPYAKTFTMTALGHVNKLRL